MAAFYGVQDALQTAMVTATQGKQKPKGNGLVPPSLGITDTTGQAPSLDPLGGLQTSTGQTSAPVAKPSAAPTSGGLQTSTAAAGAQSPKRRGGLQPKTITQVQEDSPGSIEHLMRGVDSQFASDPLYAANRDKYVYRLQRVAQQTQAATGSPYTISEARYLVGSDIDNLKNNAAQVQAERAGQDPQSVKVRGGRPVPSAARARLASTTPDPDAKGPLGTVWDAIGEAIQGAKDQSGGIVEAMKGAGHDAGGLISDLIGSVNGEDATDPEDKKVVAEQARHLPQSIHAVASDALAAPGQAIKSASGALSSAAGHGTIDPKVYEDDVPSRVSNNVAAFAPYLLPGVGQAMGAVQAADIAAQIADDPKKAAKTLYEGVAPWEAKTPEDMILRSAALILGGAHIAGEIPGMKAKATAVVDAFRNGKTPDPATAAEVVGATAPKRRGGGPQPVPVVPPVEDPIAPTIKPHDAEANPRFLTQDEIDAILANNEGSAVGKAGSGTAQPSDVAIHPRNRGGRPPLMSAAEQTAAAQAKAEAVPPSPVPAIGDAARYEVRPARFGHDVVDTLTGETVEAHRGDHSQEWATRSADARNLAASTPTTAPATPPRPPNPVETVAPPAAPEPAPEPSGGIQADEPRTAVRNSVVESERAARGLDPVERQPYTTPSQAEAAGRAAVDGGADHVGLAREVAERPRPISAQEHGVLLAGREDLLSDAKSAGMRLDDAIERGEPTEPLQAAYDEAQRKLDVNDQALVRSGTETSASLNSRRMGRPFDLADPESMLAEARRAKGGKLDATTAEAARAKSEELASAERAYDDAQARKSSLEASTVVAEESRKVRATERNGDRVTRRAGEKERLKAEMSDLSTQFGKSLSGTANSGLPLGPEQVRLLGKMAHNAIHQGALTLEEVVDFVREHLPEGARSRVEDRQIHDALTGYGQERQPRTQAEGMDMVRELKRQATLHSQIEDASKGRRVSMDSHPATVTPSQMVANLTKVRDALWKEKGLDVRTERLRATVDEQLSRLEARANEVHEATEAGVKWTANRPRPRVVEDPVVTEARTKLREAISENRITDRIADLERQIATKSFTPPNIRTPYDGKLAELALRRDTLRKEARAMIEAQRPRSFGEKAGAAAMDLVSAPRSLMAGFDLSAPMRQGSMLLLANPVEGAASFGKMLRAFADKAYSHHVNTEITEGARAPLYKRAGLYLSDAESSHMNAHEEGFVSKLVGRIPGVGQFHAAGERAYTTFLNAQRSAVFDGLTDGKGLTDAELRHMANYINVASGRGHLPGSLEKASESLSQLLFAPRYMTSRFEIIGGAPILHGDGSMMTRRIVAQEYAKYAAGVVGAIGLAKAAGVQVSGNPTSSDFLKMRIGNTRIDMLAGLQQAFVFAARMATGESTSAAGHVTHLAHPKFGGQDRLGLAGQFLRSKLAPVPGLAVDALDGKDGVGQPFDLGKKAAALFTPMVFNDTKEAMQAHGVPEGIGIGILAAIGLGVSTFDPPAQKVRGHKKNETPEQAQTRRRHHIVDELLRKSTGGLSRTDVNEYRANHGMPPIEGLQ